MSRSRRTAAVATLAGVMAVAPVSTALAAPASEATTGPSTSTSPYVVPVAAGVSTTSLLTVGDTVGDYRMVGIPDGLGALASANGVEVLMTHELGSTAGIPRDHGQKGAFVSRWTVDPATGAVTSGSDLIQSAKFWNYGIGDYSGTASAFNRFCSASLTDPGQLYNKATRNGFDGQVFFGNEESGDEGRTFGITLDGTATQLPRLGLFSSENTLVAPTRGDATVVLGNEDDNPGQVRVYTGVKQSTGSDLDKAGLTNGALHVLTVPGVIDDAAFRSSKGKGVAVPATFTEIDWTKNGATQNAEAAAKGISLNRIEDGAFDPRKPNDYYFLTTDGGDATVPAGYDSTARQGGGLWLLRFADVNDPSKGATLTLLLDGSEAPYLYKPDNMAIDNGGNILLQEDPGNDAHVARIVAYRIADGATGVVAEFDRAQFTGAGAITLDEESSGIIDVSRLWNRPNTFLFDAQVHKSLADPELVQMGQLMTLTVQSWGQVYSGKG